jgi:uncharacterized membrane protein
MEIEVMSEVFKVIYTGEVKPGTNRDRITVLFSEKFKLGPDKAKKLIHSGRPVTLKKDIDQEKAEKYQESLEKMGLVIELDPKPPVEVPEQPDKLSELSLVSFDNDDEDATEVLDSSLNPASDRCPKCGSPNMEMGICQDCGIVAAKYHMAQAGGAKIAAQNEPEKDEWVAEENPYNTPEAELTQSMEGDMTGPQSVVAVNGFKWVGKGWWHFKQAPISWLVVSLIWFVLILVISSIPFLGVVAINVLTPVLIAGLMIGCYEQDQGDDFSLSHLFAGFANNAGQAVMVGVFYLLFLIFLFTGLGLLLFGSIGDLAALQGNPEAIAMVFLSPSVQIGILVGALLIIPVMMAYLFAPALVVLDDMTAWEAMKASFMGCLKNILPLFLYSFAALAVIIMGITPFALLLLAISPIFIVFSFILGMLVITPILIASIYAAYRDIYYS